jgi:hypothetical protein
MKIGGVAGAGMGLIGASVGTPGFGQNLMNVTARLLTAMTLIHLTFDLLICTFCKELSPKRGTSIVCSANFPNEVSYTTTILVS